jgi:putative transposase
MRYIELKPVRANMVANASGYRWSSFLATASGRENVMMTPHPVYQELGDTQEARAYAYRKSFEEEAEGVDRSAIDEEIRSATKQGVLVAGTTFAAARRKRGLTPNSHTC